MFVIDSKERIKDSDEFACIFIDYNSSLKKILCIQQLISVGKHCTKTLKLKQFGKNPLSCKFHLQKLTKFDEFLIFVKMWRESISYNRKDLD